MSGESFRVDLRGIVDILVQPTPDGVDIRDWKAYAPAVDAGYRAMAAELETLDGLKQRDDAMIARGQKPMGDLSNALQFNV